MAELKTLTVQKRDELGKGFNRRLRQQDMVPGVFYSPAGLNVAVKAPALPLSKIFASVGRTTVFNLDIDGQVHPVLIWAVKFHPYKRQIDHIDFYGVDLDKPVKITVPLEFTGVARGTKVGGTLETYREQVVLLAKPLEMPAHVTVDISGLDIGKTITVSDLVLPEGVKASYDVNYAIVAVVTTTAETEEV